MHVDLARSAAALSAEILASDPPKVRVVDPNPQEQPLHPQATKQTLPTAGGGDTPEADDPADDAPRLIKVMSPEAQKAQDRLDYLLQQFGFEAMLLAALETSAALGNVGLRVNWNKELFPEGPFLDWIASYAVIPEFHYGRQTAVTYWSVVAVESGSYYRWLEYHEKGQITHALYKGDAERVGVQVPLTDQPATAWVLKVENARPEGNTVVIPTSVDRRTGLSVPNVLPDNTDLENRAGRSDFTPGVMSVFHAIDETYSLMMNEIRMAKGRLIVDQSMLTDNGAGRGQSFNIDQQVFVGLNMPPAENDNAAPITISQFQMRVDGYLSAINALIERAIKDMGYSPRSTGDGQAQQEAGTAKTATEIVSDDRRTANTRDKKLRYLQPALNDILTTLLAVDAEVFGQGPALQVEVEFPESNQATAIELAQTAAVLAEAKIASREVIVDTLHPDWDERQKAEEVERLIKENAAAMPPALDPTTLGLTPRPAGPAADQTADQ
jgi:A118 family predicted phage portal protein